jgi:hypothetical protein
MSERVPIPLPVVVPSCVTYLCVLATETTPDLYSLEGVFSHVEAILELCPHARVSPGCTSLSEAQQHIGRALNTHGIMEPLFRALARALTVYTDELDQMSCSQAAVHPDVLNTITMLSEALVGAITAWVAARTAASTHACSSTEGHSIR